MWSLWCLCTSLTDVFQKKWSSFLLLRPVSLVHALPPWLHVPIQPPVPMHSATRARVFTAECWSPLQFACRDTPGRDLAVFSQESQLTDHFSPCPCLLLCWPCPPPPHSRTCNKFDCGCVCDLLPDACDANCCCDSACPAGVVAAVNAAGQCLPAGPAPSTVSYCVDADQFVAINARTG